MRLLSSTNVANGQVTYTFPSGQLGMIQVVFDVVTLAAQILTLDLCGNVRLNWTGEDIINVPVRLINLINNLYGGCSEATFGLAGVNRVSIFLTPGLTYDAKTVYDIGQNDNVTLTLDFRNIVPLCASGTVKIYAKDKIGTMSYIHKILPKFCISQAAGQVPDSIPVNNISELYLDDPATNLITGVQVVKDNITVVDSQSLDDLQAYNNYIHLVETPVTNILAIDLGESKDIRELIGGTLTYRMTFSGAATLPLYYGFISNTGQKLVESQNRAAKMLSVKTNNSIS